MFLSVIRLIGAVAGAVWLLLLSAPLAHAAGCRLPLRDQWGPCRAAVLWAAPPTPPLFIQSHSRVLRLHDDYPYLFIVDTYNTWEPARKSVSASVTETLAVRVNGRRVPAEQVAITPNQVVSLMRQDAAGHTYSHGGDITVALHLPGLKPDIYAIDVAFETNAGTPLMFTWAVCVPYDGHCSPNDLQGQP